MIAYAGDWEPGCALVEQGAQLNPRHPGWHWFPLFYNAYRKGDYRGALNVALKIKGGVGDTGVGKSAPSSSGPAVVG